MTAATSSRSKTTVVERTCIISGILEVNHQASQAYEKHPRYEPLIYMNPMTNQPQINSRRILESNSSHASKGP
jgi:hypothetical protein